MDVASLDGLLAPLSSQAFFADYWEQRQLHLQRGRPEFYRQLLAPEQIDELIARSDGRYPAIQLSKQGSFFAPEAYTRNVRMGDEVFNGVPDVEKIFTEYLAGATVSLPALQRTWPPLGALCSALERELDHAVHANAYITPAGSAGFTAHYDTHEVLVLQIAGSKRWRIDGPPIHLPHRSQPFSLERYVRPAQPLAEVELRAGDLLYLPRGYVHSTLTENSFSAHVTLGITVYTWVELASELLQSCISEERWRRALPCGFASRRALRPELASMLRELLASLQNVDLDRSVETFLQRTRSARPRTAGIFHADVSSITANTTLRVSSKHFELQREGEHTVLWLEGRRVVLPGAVRALLEVMGNGSTFEPQTLPDSLSLEGKLALVRYLHGLGFLEPLSSADATSDVDAAGRSAPD